MITFYLLINGIFIALAIYHLLVYIGRRSDYSNLAYFFYCIGLSGALYIRRIYPFIVPTGNTFFSQSFFLVTTHVSSFGLALFGYTSLDMKKYRFSGLYYKLYTIFSLIGIPIILLYVFLKLRFFFSLYLISLGCFGGTFTILIFYHFFKNYNLLKQKDMIIVAGFALITGLLITAAVGIVFNIIIPFSVLYSCILLNAILFAYALTHGFNKEHNDLIDLKNTLEQKVADRTAELQQAKQEVENQSRQKTDFYINLSHETKTPLTIIINLIDSLIKNHPELVEEMVPIKYNVEKLRTDMVNFLDYEKLQQGRAFYNHDSIINLSRFVRKKIEAFKTITDKKHRSLTATINNDIHIKIDPAAMDRILNNLLDNAVKYTNPDDRITIELSANDGEITLIISDTGIGIPENELANIFVPYHQISHQKRNTQGIGMGLNIVKQIIDQVNGNITVKSIVNTGSKFIFTFKEHQLSKNDPVVNIYTPAELATIPPDIKIKENEINPNFKTMLIVEDNRNLAAYLQDQFRDTYNIFFAFNGREALERIPEIPHPDIIISDIMMDEIDGFTFKQALDHDLSLASIPFIFLTAKSDKQSTLAGLTGGAVDFISKPFRIEVLKAKVEAIITQQQFKEVISIDNYHKQRITNLKTYLHDHNITEIEEKIIMKMADGKPNKTISAEMNVKEITIKKHVSTIFTKLNIKNRSRHEIVRLVGRLLDEDK